MPITSLPNASNGKPVTTNDSRFFAVETAGRIGYIVAAVMVSEEDEGEYFNPSKLWSEMPY